MLKCFRIRVPFRRSGPVAAYPRARLRYQRGSADVRDAAPGAGSGQPSKQHHRPARRTAAGGARNRQHDQRDAEAGRPQDAATAQDESQGNHAAQNDDIVVIGLRGSLQRNLDIKRTSSGVVDVISAEDIGKFPDSNVAASLQRLPGVSIQRSGSRGEPTGITVRGFGGDFNTTLYDGRRISTATGGRQIDFSTVGVDFVGQLSVSRRRT